MDPIENILIGKAFKNELSERKFIFNEFRQRDESHLWPIKGKFNVTNRAIRRLIKFERESGMYMIGLELIYFL